MTNLPASTRSSLRRIARRVRIGQFFEVWPKFAAGAFLLAGSAALVCRMFIPQAADFLIWLWILPAVSLLPAAILTFARPYKPDEIAALADSLSGGDGTLLATLETGSVSWTSKLEKLSNVPLPALRVRRQAWPIVPALGFLVLALLAPQRTTPVSGSEAAAESVAAELQGTVAKLKEQNLITPEEEKKLEEEIEKIRQGAMQRMDASAWEAADALREKTIAALSEKQDALKWAEESLARYAAAAQGGEANAQAQHAELAEAIGKLASSGLLADASPELQKLLGTKGGAAGGKIELPTDAQQLRRLSDLLSAELNGRAGKFGDLASLGNGFGKFDPSEYPDFDSNPGPDADGDPGTGGVNRGRADADLTWGKETPSFDRFKATPLPPGAVRSPDDWSPAATLPGGPTTSPEMSAAAQPYQYATAAGQAAWRRSLAPRHNSAVKKYFENKR